MVFGLQMARKTLCNTDEHIEMAVQSQKRCGDEVFNM